MLGAQASHRRVHPASEAGSAPGIKNVFWQPNELKQGSVAFFTVEVDRVPARVTATWIGKRLDFFKSDNPKIWYALAGDDLETQPGTYDLNVTAVLPGGRAVRSVKQVEVGAADFKTGSLDVPENYVEPDAEGKREIARDEVLKNRAYAHFTPRPLWSGNFIKPVDGPATPTFGESRILNEERSSTHRGTDFPVKEGTPVTVSNSGTVVLSQALFYEGNCVIVDHGDRLFTIYMHLSRMDVKDGDKLTKGQKIGLSGASGRVTGPHMHMGVRWDGAYLDPVQLLALTLPRTAAASERSPGPRRHTRRRR
jgi:murein DD-endopeptidase MepM/ murein hydrolase activator NlpD